MIIRKEDMNLRVRDNIKGGKGTIEDLKILEPEMLSGRCSLCSKFFIDPGDSLGEHTHQKDAELYYVLEGELTVVEDGAAHLLKPGDAAFATGGVSHWVENRSGEQAVMLGIIFE
ncbi:MAG: cupin domain-containing protein [Oscillospiraceae bacterium]|nr:cupin domain-containing protein [Oscillospiraceae bacterium]